MSLVDPNRARGPDPPIYPQHLPKLLSLEIVNDYLNLLLSYPHPQSILLIALLGMMRIAPIVVLAPFFGAKLLPGPVKMGLIVSITAVFLPHLVV